MSADRLAELISHLRTALDRGQRAYWVCPLVEESEKIDLAAAEERAVMLRQALGLKAPHQIGLVHGKMKATDRDAAMAAFKAGETQLLVATTVIEVGVDVPQATIMVVEHAERFGLSQLHQLRGRVGRGSGKSSCILLWHEPLGETAKARLKIMRETDDGFVICAVPARCWETAKAAWRNSASPIRPPMPTCWRWRMTMRASSSSATPTSNRRAARRSGYCCICSGATKRCAICAPDKKKPAEAGFFPSFP